MFYNNRFFEGCRLFLAPGTMKIESGVVFFTYWLWETYGGLFLNYDLTCFRASMFCLLCFFCVCVLF